MIKKFHANQARQQRHRRMRYRVSGTPQRPRLCVFRSDTHIYAQVIDDTTGRTLVSASSLEESLREFKTSKDESLLEKAGDVAQAVAGTVADTVSNVVEMAAEALPTKKGKSAKAEKAPAQQQKGQQQKGQQGKGGNEPAQVKTQLPTAQKGPKKTPVEALAAISNNHKVAVAREVGKLVAQRAKDKGINRVVFDRGGYAYHGRVAALAEGAREVGLDF
jgi:ribosomal protein L18